MDDKGMGIDGDAGNILNNTIVRNTNTPKYVEIVCNVGSSFQPIANDFRHYKQQDNSDYTGPYIVLNNFYMATTETTQAQFACFTAAVDLKQRVDNGVRYVIKDVADWKGMCNAKTPMIGYSNISIAKYLGIGHGYYAGDLETAPVLFTTEEGNNNTTRGETRGASIMVTDGTDDSRVFYPTKQNERRYSGGKSVGNGQGGTGNIQFRADPLVRDNFPMGNVSWFGGVAFCAWIGGMLPTEAQWEYAARKTAFNRGDNITGLQQGTNIYAGGILNRNDAGWYDLNAGVNDGKTNAADGTETPHEVALLKATPIGLYDMNGNVCEWCCDVYNTTAFITHSYPPNVASAPAGVFANDSSFNVSDNVGNDGNTPDKPLYNPIMAYRRSTDIMLNRRVTRGGSWEDGADGTAHYFGLGSRNPQIPHPLVAFGFRSIGCPEL
jgi:formylglycine-generating enzyme required for sulfatase activity